MLLKGEKGWINARLKYVRDLQNKLNRSASNISMHSIAADQNTTIENTSNDDEAAANDVLFLKTLVVSDEVMETIFQKLNSTREYRKKMLLDKTIHLKEHFPYFFTHPQLVKLSKKYIVK